MEAKDNLEVKDIFKCSDRGKAAFAEVLLSIREQAGLAYARDEGGYGPKEASWDKFLNLAQTKGILAYPSGDFIPAISLSMTEKYAAKTFSTVPNAGLFFLIESWGIFTYPNTKEKITFMNLFEVIQELRLPTGELKRANSQPSP